MKAEKRKLPISRAMIAEDHAVVQEMIILPDGRVELPWITPEATCLVLAVWRAFSDEPFPVRVLSGNLYCG
ncbi:MAG: hypothetical protein ACM3KE_10480 [Hyphomicrobiales bacterium]